MTVLTLTNEILFTKSKDFDFKNPQFDIIEFSKNLAETMINEKALSISAIQVGSSYNIFCLTGTPIKVFVNPKLLNTSQTFIEFEETCCSIKNLNLKITRPDEIRIRYTQPNGEVITETFKGLTANRILHELEHLNGGMFYNNVSLYHKEKAFRLKSKRDRNVINY